MCGSPSTYNVMWDEDLMKYKCIFKKSGEDTISFYASWGEDCGDNATDWCKEHCYMKTCPFPHEDLSVITSMRLQYCDRAKDIYAGIIKATDGEIKYVTLFASGCIEEICYGDRNWGSGATQFMRDVATNLPDKSIRVFIRNPKCIVGDLPNNTTIIQSVDCETNPDLLRYGLTNRRINSIAVVDHPDNRKVIEQISHDLHTIRCSNCHNGKLCFHQTKKFLLILNYFQGE